MFCYSGKPNTWTEHPWPKTLPKLNQFGSLPGGIRCHPRMIKKWCKHVVPNVLKSHGIRHCPDAPTLPRSETSTLGMCLHHFRTAWGVAGVAPGTTWMRWKGVRGAEHTNQTEAQWLGEVEISTWLVKSEQGKVQPRLRLEFRSGPIPNTWLS